MVVSPIGSITSKVRKDPRPLEIELVPKELDGVTLSNLTGANASQIIGDVFLEFGCQKVKTDNIGHCHEKKEAVDNVDDLVNR